MINCARPAFEPVRLKNNGVSNLLQESLGSALALEAAREVAALFQSHSGRARIDLEALEVAVKSTMMDLGSALMSMCINADRSDGEAAELSCQCGAVAKRAGRRRKRLVSALGVLSLKRTYYHCDGCGGGFFPKDRQLGIEGQSISQAVMAPSGSEMLRATYQIDVTLSRIFLLNYK